MKWAKKLRAALSWHPKKTCCTESCTSEKPQRQHTKTVTVGLLLDYRNDYMQHTHGARIAGKVQLSRDISLNTVTTLTPSRVATACQEYDVVITCTPQMAYAVALSRSTYPTTSARHIHIDTTGSHISPLSWANTVDEVRTYPVLLDTLLGAVRALQPDASRLLLPYCPTFTASLPTGVPSALDAAPTLSDLGLEVITVPVYAHGYGVNNSFLKKHSQPGDILLMLGISGLRPLCKELAELCTLNKIIMCADDRSAVFRGAAIGMGPRADFATQKVLSVLLNNITKQHPAQHLIQPDNIVYYNPETIRRLRCEKDLLKPGKIDSFENVFKLK